MDSATTRHPPLHPVLTPSSTVLSHKSFTEELLARSPPPLLLQVNWGSPAHHENDVIVHVEVVKYAWRVENSAGGPGKR